tara:strand:+ start:252 stop:1904 length:1653 start_codon:yes stop_codon:yes gene_type:complete
MNKKYTITAFFFLTLSIFSNEEWIDGLCEDGQGYIEFTFGEYYGECKDERTEHGFGTFIFEDTSTLSSYFSHLEDGAVYEGEWVDAYMEGTGALTRPDGSTYQGNFYRGRMHGLGYETKPDGTGSFVMYEDNNLSSKDYLSITSNGSSNVRQFWRNENGEGPQQYIGGMSRGERSGKGTYVWFGDNYQTKSTYEGDWVDNSRTGKGKFIWPDGDTYEGDFVDGIRTGKGKLIWDNGNTYEGDFVDGKRTGIGTWIAGRRYTTDSGKQYEKGEIYNGMYKENNRHGFGIVIMPDGTSIPRLYNLGELLDVDGFCLEGNCEKGRGSYINAKGELYEGKWADGKRHGAGTLTNVLDNTSVKSLWEDDVALCDFSQAKVIDRKLTCGNAENSNASNDQKQIASDEKKIKTAKKINAIVFSDLHWEMSEEEIKEAMNTKSNGVCTDMGLVVTCFVNNFNTLLILDSVNERIYFSCGVYNGCSYSPEEMSEIIGKRFGLRDWEYQIEFGGVYGQFYCAKGKAGDKICTSKTVGEDGTTQNGVYLAKGALGSSGLDF